MKKHPVCLGQILQDGENGCLKRVELDLVVVAGQVAEGGELRQRGGKETSTSRREKEREARVQK